MKKYIKGFEGESIFELEEEVNLFLGTLDAERVIDIQHSGVAVSHDGAAMKLYTAIVTYLFDEALNDIPFKRDEFEEKIKNRPVV
ncbi:hypothetical protein P40081_15225 [Paenibacillus sp. FSL P4-0081]|uniref:sporulation protein Cse60 n=1 Tax=Paenibacillus sp. FSL P4-0081 TaxID=1536769 RepID=UPI0004F8F5E1|nr:sporulation protein Cse60 [Paenibacillus sp. FSL P4-0081]AIQ29349.1 hypothetical protein P40081_15225 [Paenibacillus sp. FSL P4-0081]